MMAEMAIAGINSGAFGLTGSTTAKAIGVRMGVEAGTQLTANTITHGRDGWRETDFADVALAGIGLNYVASAGLESSIDFTPFSTNNKFTTIIDKDFGTTAIDFGSSFISGGQKNLLEKSNLDRNLINVLNGWNQTKSKSIGAISKQQINEE